MSPYLVSILAQVAACQARLMAMQVANAGIDLQAYPPKYDHSHFFAVEQELLHLAEAARLTP